MQENEPVEIDPEDVLAARTGGPRSARRLTRLLARSVAQVWRAGKVTLFIVLGLQVVAAVALAAQVILIERVLAVILEVAEDPDSLVRLWLPVGLLTLVMAVGSLSGSVQATVDRLLGEQVSAAMWRDVLRTATSVSLRHFERPAFYDRLQRVENNALFRPYQVTQGLTVVIGSLLGSVGIAVVLLTLHPVLLPLMVLGGVPLVVTSRMESRLEFDFAVEQTQPERLREYLISLQTTREEAAEVRAFNLAPALGRRIEALYRTYLEALRRHTVRRARLSALGNLGAAISLAATLGIMVWLVALGEIEVAAAGAAVVATRMLATQLQNLTHGVRLVFESGLFLDDVEQFLRMDTGEGAVDLPDPPEQFRTLEARDVVFTYPGSDRRTLDGVNVRIGAGEVIALVGANGSGKTTLAKILAGLYPPGGGAVLWDGVDARTFRPAGVRARTAVVLQDYVEYALSAHDNVTIGRLDEPTEEVAVRRAAAAAGIDQTLANLPQGYATVLSRMFPGGRDLSGGQWQRVAIARAFFRDSPLVILDEPTAAMDPRAEHELFSSLRTLLEGRSAVVVSHRFSTVRSADRIYVMDGGRVVEEGSHDELMARGGLYADLFRLQARAYLEATG